MNTVTSDTESPGQFTQTLRVRAHTLRADVMPATGGTDSAPDPHDYFDTALAACKSATATWYAKKHGIPLERVHVVVHRDDADERKGAYRLRLELRFEGALSAEQRASLERAVGACPIHKLMTTSEITIETAVA